jgi:hypothetical protein
MTAIYKILAADGTNGTITLQFTAQAPVNVRVPCINGVFISGEVLEGWIQSQHNSNYWDGTITASGWNLIQARVSDGVAMPYPRMFTTDTQFINTGTMS